MARPKTLDPSVYRTARELYKMETQEILSTLESQRLGMLFRQLFVKHYGGQPLQGYRTTQNGKCSQKVKVYHTDLHRQVIRSAIAQFRELGVRISP